MLSTGDRAQSLAVVDGGDDAETAKSVARGLLIGAALGGVIGVIVLTLTIPGLGEIALAGLLAGGLWGAFLGGFAGLVAKVRWDDAEDRWCVIPQGAARGC